MKLGFLLISAHVNLHSLASSDPLGGCSIFWAVSGTARVSPSREAVYAFGIRGLSAKDVVRRFVSRGVIVHDRCSDAYSGHTMTRLGVDAVVRVSFAHYTSFEEVDRFLVALKEIVEENGT